jgi:hypothetical protein
VAQVIELLLRGPSSIPSTAPHSKKRNLIGRGGEDWGGRVLVKAGHHPVKTPNKLIPHQPGLVQVTLWAVHTEFST